MRKTLAVAFAAFAVAACDTREVETDPGLLPADDTQQTDEQVVVARADFQPTAQAEGLNVSGWAEFRQQGATWQDGLELNVHLMGLGEGDHAWHIHQGTCESPGQVVLPISSFGDRDGVGDDLEAGGDGIAEATVRIDRDRLAGLNLEGNHVIAVHLRGSDNPGPPIACAPIDLRGGAAGVQSAPGTHPGAQPAPGTQPGATQPGAPRSY
jgi:Cu/Zn superoxide dismutase